MEVSKVLFQAVVSFFVLFIISKLLGKKQIAQLEFTDYVVGISLGSIAANMVMEPSLEIYHYIIGMAVFGLLDYFISILSRKGVFFKKLFIGKPLIIIKQGKINYKNLKKSKLDINELISQCRLAGYFNLSEIYFCIFETNGNFSFLPVSEAYQTKREDLKIEKKQEEMPVSLVIDGKVILKHLQNVNQTEEDLYKKLKISSKKDLRNILLASYDPSSKKLIVFNKDD